MNKLALNSAIINHIREISQKIDNLINPIAGRYGLTALQLKMIITLGARETELPIGELGRSVGVSGGNISNICKKLEKDNFLTRQRSKEDERVVYVGLTDHGQAIFDDLVVMFKNRFVLPDQINSKDIEQIEDSLAQLNRLLDIYVEAVSGDDDGK